MMNTILGLALLATPSAMTADNKIYDPIRSIKDQGIQLSSWGSGTINETTEVAFEGTNSLRVSFRNYFQGGRINFAKPFDVKPLVADRDNLLTFTMRLASTSVVISGNGGGASSPGSGPGRGPGSGPGGGGSGPGAPAGGEEGQGRGPGGGLGGGTQAAAPKTLANFRVVITTTDGKKSEAFVSVPTGADKSWLKAGVPLQAISGFADTNGQIKDLSISGDSSSTVYVGQIKVQNDSTPITGRTNRTEANLGAGQELELIGYGLGGSTALKYSWDFDESDGIQDEGQGQAIKKKFRKTGKFVVTLTISDVFGLKTPYTTKVNITVN